MAALGRITRLLLTTDAVGGVWQYSLDLAAGLVSCGVQTILAVLGPAPTPHQRAHAQAVAGLELIETGLPLDWLAESPAEIRASGTAIAALAFEAGADIVQLGAPALAAEAVFAVPVVAVCHSCVRTWWHAVAAGPMPADFIWRSALVEKGYAAAQLLVAPSQAFAQATQAAYGLAEPPLVVNNARTPRSAVAAHDAPPIFVFTAARLWDAGKNLTALDRIAARLSIPVLAAGSVSGPNGERVALPHIRTLGQLDDDAVAQWLAARPVFVSVARYEPFGLAVLEAAQAGCALLLSDIPTFQELWGDAALSLPANDAAAAAMIARIATDAGARDELGRRARHRARSFSVATMARAMARCYDTARGRLAA